MKEHRESGYFLLSIEPIAREVIDELSGGVRKLTIDLIGLIGPGLELRTGCGCTDNGKVHQWFMKLLDQHLPFKIVRG